MIPDKFNPMKIAELAKAGKELKNELLLANKEIEEMVIMAESTCQTVKVLCNGNGMIYEVIFNQDRLNSDTDVDLSEATTEAIKKVQSEAVIISAERRRKVTEKVGLPSDFNFNI
ncbi:MAG: YbaB/EbfC family nucleoid-associated protein [Paracoccaceae bacterium]|nr:YbaB/EbfC family nucleoid-associated protein [Paracoccaceae bacterium]MDE2674865.1 YbaB/EbfC family nucleoid-associated protein [Paracoccaceae bacterium]